MNSKGKILVVDDSSISLRLMENILTENEYTVFTADSGESALSSVTNILPDLILLDIQMIDMNGFEVCRKLKKHALTQNIPVIFLSALIKTEDKVKGFELGAVDFISKPFQYDELLARVQTHLLISKMRVQLEKQTLELKATNLRLENEINLRKEAEERYDAFINADLDMIFLKDDQFRYLIVNDAMANFFGKTKEEMIGKTDRELAPVNLTIPCKSSDIRALDSDTAFRVEEKLGDHFCETTKFPLHLSGNKRGIGGIIRNISEKKSVEDSLRKFILGIENSSDAIFITDRNGIIEYINPAFEKIYGYCISDIIDQTPRILKSGLLSQADYEHFWNTLLSKESVSGVIQNKAKDGRIVSIESTNNPILDGNDEIIGFISINRDISEKKQIELALKESETRLDLFFSQSMDGFFFMMLDKPIEWNDKTDKDQILEQAFSHLKITRINDAMLDQYGATSEQFIGITLNEFFEHNINHGKRVIHELFDKGRLRAETDERKLNGETIIIEGDYTCIHDSQGQIIGLFGIQRDITQTKKQSDALILSESKYRYLFENNPAPMWIYDLITLCFLEVNDAAVANYGYLRQEFLQMTLKDIRPQDDVQALLLDVESTTKILNNAGNWRHQRKNGEIIFVEIISHKIEYENREARLVISTDITARVKAENAIKDERKLLKTLIDNIPDAIYIKDASGRKLITNPADIRILNLTNESEIIGKTDLEIIPGPIGERGFHDDMQVIKTCLPIINKEEYFGLTDNQPCWLLTSKIPISDNTGKIIGLVGIGRDVTERKKGAEMIVKLSTAIEQSPLSITITNDKGDIEYSNPSFSTISGYSADEVKGKNQRFLKSGETPPEGYKNLWETISSGKEWRGEFHNRKKNGELYWVSATISPICNEKGEIINYIAIKEDITKQKQLMNELIESKEKAEESDRLKSAFLANMSHEIRTPLNGILGFSELLADPDFDQSQKTDMAKIILDNGDQLLAIINDVLDISKIEAGQIEIHKTEFSANQMIRDIQKTFLPRASILGVELKIDPTIPSKEMQLKSDYMRVKQVLTNLVSNALKFTDKGSIEIGFSKTNTGLIFHVKDTGTGIPKEFHHKIFERFRHLEPNRSKIIGGNGLGLAISKSFIEMLGGKIWVESEEGKGSCFYFTIPF